MADDEGALTQLSSGNYGADFLGAKLRSVVRTPAAVAHPGQINRRDAKVAGEVRRNVTPPVAMCTAAMNEKKPALARSRRLAPPMQVVDPAPRYHHELRLPGVGNGPPKPIWRRRTDRKEIGWYGFAAQGGCTRITGSVLPLISQHYIGEGPCSFRYPPSTARSRGPRGPPACSSIRRPGAVEPGTLDPSPPRRTEGSNPSPSTGESCEPEFSGGHRIDPEPSSIQLHRQKQPSQLSYAVTSAAAADEASDRRRPARSCPASSGLL
jgi:hypothetical protein